jgi:hypothetical protein
MNTAKSETGWERVRGWQTRIDGALLEAIKRGA